MPEPSSTRAAEAIEPDFSIRERVRIAREMKSETLKEAFALLKALAVYNDERDEKMKDLLDYSQSWLRNQKGLLE